MRNRKSTIGKSIQRWHPPDGFDPLNFKEDFANALLLMTKTWLFKEVEKSRYFFEKIKTSTSVTKSESTNVHPFRTYYSISGDFLKLT